MPPSPPTTANGASHRIEVFQYEDSPHAPSPIWEGWPRGEAADAAASDHPAVDPLRMAAEAALRVEFERGLADEARKAFEVGRERGRQEGRQSEREAQAGALTAAAESRVRQAAELIDAFAQERDSYLHAVEQEVVRLALDVAARILRREAQMDPLLLTGAVRVALGQLSGSTQVTLRVPAGELNLWSASIALFPHLAIRPTVVSGDAMRLGDCVIETELGSVDLGIRSQLGEIERGFFDRAGGSAPRRSSPPADPRFDTDQEPGPELDPELGPEIGREPASQTGFEPRLVPGSETRRQPRPHTRPDTRPDTRTNIGPEPSPATSPATRLATSLALPAGRRP